MTILTPTQTLYDRDFQLWIEATSAQLRCQDFSAVDWTNLIEELDSMGISNQHAIESLLTQLLVHLFKLFYWDSEREYNANKWRAEIINFRIQIRKLLQKSPSLKPYLTEIFAECNEDARKIVSALIGQKIPSKPIATFAETLNEDWFPDLKEVPNL